MLFHKVMLANIVLLAACGDIEPLPWIPSVHLIVDGLDHDVEFREWCNDEKPCDLLGRQDVHWEIQPDGQIKIMQGDHEMRFERGTFSRSAEDVSTWIVDEEGDYLLATTTAQRALIIHYPIERVVTAEEVEIIEDPATVEKLGVNELIDCPTAPIDQDLMNRTKVALLNESNKGKFLLW